MKHPARDFLTMMAIAIVVFIGLRTTVQTFVVYGPSMQPTFWENQRLIVNKLVYRFGEPQRLDVIVFKPPHDRSDSYIKRVIALPGEQVEMKYGRVYIHQPDGNVFELEEPYVTEHARREYVSATIPAGSYFVLGDNRNNTNDSRNGWLATEEDIIGKAWVSIWPPDMWGMVNAPPTSVASAAGD